MKRRAILSLAISLAWVAPALGQSVFDGGLAPPPPFSAPADTIAPPLSAGSAGETAAPEAAPKHDLSLAARSLLIPGLAQGALGRTTRARVYYGIETLTWIAFGSFLYAGYEREDEYKEFATVFAGVAGTDHPDEYWEHVGEYLASEGPGGYNEIVRRDARDAYYPDVEAMNSYYEANAYEGAEGWSWRSSGEFYQYGSLRDDSRFAYRYAIYTLFFAATMRVVSAADAMRIIRLESPQEEEASEGASLELSPTPGGAALCFRRPF